MRKKLLSVLLTLAMLLSLIPAGYAADIEIVDEPDLEIFADDVQMIDGVEIHVNPLYRDQISAEELAASLREAAETEAVSYSCASIEEAAAAFEKLLETLVRAAEVETTMKKMLDEIEKTKRRVNALEFKVIPELDDAQRFVKSRLEEMERENTTRLKHLKGKEAAE